MRCRAVVGRSAIVDEARSWVGTPFIWQASAKGQGADCKGLIWGIARELGMPEAGSIYSSMVGDHRGKVDARLLKQGLAATLAQTDVAQPGDVLLLTVGGKAQHLGIVTEGGRMVHTYGKGPRGVIEVPIGKSRPIDSIWTWRSLA